MSEFIAEGLVDGQRVILVKTVDGTIEQTNAFLAEVVVDDGSGHLQRCIAIKELGGGGGASALSDLSDVDLSGLEDGQCLIYDSESGKWINGTIEALPDQTGNAGKSLYTDGTDASWEVTRDPNTYRSLSSVQETTLLDNGTYNGEEVTSGEIFIGSDGSIEQYIKENLGEGVETTTYGSNVVVCDKLNENNILYGCYADDYSKILVSTNGGKTFTETASNRGSVANCKNWAMTYDNGTLYILSSNGTSTWYVDWSSDLTNWNRASVAMSSYNYTWGTNIFLQKIDTNTIIISCVRAGQRAEGHVLDLTTGTFTSAFSYFYSAGNKQCLYLNGVLFNGGSYSQDLGVTWTDISGLAYGTWGIMVKDSKMYVYKQNESEVYESSDGISFTLVGTTVDEDTQTALVFTSIWGDGVEDVYYGEKDGNIYFSDNLLEWKKIADGFGGGKFFSISANVFFKVVNASGDYAASTRGEAGVIYSKRLETLNGSSSDSSAPTDDVTVGYVGQIYVDTANGNAYVCVESDSTVPTYTWKQITS